MITDSKCSCCLIPLEDKETADTVLGIGPSVMKKVARLYAKGDSVLLVEFNSGKKMCWDCAKEVFEQGHGRGLA